MPKDDTSRDKPDSTQELTVVILRRLAERVRIFAAADDSTVSGVVIEALDELLRGRKNVVCEGPAQEKLSFPPLPKNSVCKSSSKIHSTPAGKWYWGLLIDKNSKGIVGYTFQKRNNEPPQLAPL